MLQEKQRENTINTETYKIIKKTNKNSDTIFWGRCHCLSGIVRLSNNKKIDGLFLVKSSSMVYANSKSCLIGLSITLRKGFNLYWIWELVIGSLYPNSCLCWKHGKLCYCLTKTWWDFEDGLLYVTTWSSKKY